MYIRQYEETDYPLLLSWWKNSGLAVPPKDAIPATTWIAEFNSVSAVALSLHCLNNKEFAFLDFFIGNPELDNDMRKEASSSLVNFVELKAKNLGYKKLFCLSFIPKLKQYYEQFGYARTYDDISSFMKEIQ